MFAFGFLQAGGDENKVKVLCNPGVAVCILQTGGGREQGERSYARGDKRQQEGAGDGRYFHHCTSSLIAYMHSDFHVCYLAVAVVRNTRKIASVEVAVL